MIDEQEQASASAGKRCKVSEENLQNNPKEKAQNAISFLSTTQGPDLVTLAVTDRTGVLVAARKVVEKYNMMQNALAKATLIKQGVDSFKNVFQPLFLKGLPEFWDPERKLIP